MNEETVYLYLSFEDMRNAKLVCVSFIDCTKLTRFAIRESATVSDVLSDEIVQ